MAQWPTFDPSTVTSVAQATDLAVQNEFQPGSTAKVIAAATAFEHGGQTPMSAYNIPYQIDEGGQLIHDAEWGPGERYTIAGHHRALLQRRHLAGRRAHHPADPVRLPAGLRARPAERPRAARARPPATCRPVSQWGADTRYTLSFGQGVAVTARPDGRGVRDDRQRRRTGAADPDRGHDQLRGQVHPGRGLAVAPGHPGQDRARAAGDPAAGAGRDEEGDEPWGIIPGYAIAAKTGTSQESNGTCALCVYGSSYIGMAPGNDPQLVVAVNVQNPRKGGYFGDVVAGPVFYQVAKDALATLKIPPDGAVPRQGTPDRAVIGGTLTPWRSVPPTPSRGRCPHSARCWASGWPPQEIPYSRTSWVASPGSPSTPASVQPGDLYVALPGARVHGAAFCADAVAAGAVAVLTDPDGRARATASGRAGVRARRPARPARRDRLLGVRGPVEPAAAHRRDRDQRQDHEHLPARVRAARGRSPDRPDRRGRNPDRPGAAAPAR